MPASQLLETSTVVLLGPEVLSTGAGHSCWGILNGPATGLVMAELIAEGKATSVDIRKLDPQRLA